MPTLGDLLESGSPARTARLATTPHIDGFDLDGISAFDRTMATMSCLGLALHGRLHHLNPMIAGGAVGERIVAATPKRAAENADGRMRDAILEVVPGCTNDLATLVVDDFRILMEDDLERRRQNP